MTDTYTSELRDIIDRAFTGEHGGRATAQMVHNSVYRDLPEHLVDFLVGSGIRSQVNSYFKAKNAEGLPQRPAVNPDGEHVQLSILSIDEYAYVHRSYLKRAHDNAEQADRIRTACLEQHGVDLITYTTAAVGQ